MIYLLSILTYKLTDKWASNTFVKVTYRVGSFLTLYSLAIISIVPVMARILGRVPLPLTETNNVQPLNIMTCLLNRNYVRSELKQTVFDVAKNINAKFPGTTINYLDANFPFINKFPLIPHLSHNDGKKLDLSFCYRDQKTGEPTNDCPSFFGYGVCEGPLQQESNMPAICADRGYWQYSFLTKVISQKDKQNFTFDSDKTKVLINLLAKQQTIGKIFIEPHLKTRLQLTTDKIRFHGCQAVRHDDHIHVQLK